MVYRATELVVSTVPVQTSVLAFIADQFLGELHGKVTWRAREILFLRFHQLAACIHGGGVISTDAPEYNLGFASGRVEIPRTAVAYQGNRKPPVLGADHYGDRSIRLCHEPMDLLVVDDQ